MPITEAKTKMLVVSAAALIDTDGRVLLTQRPADKSMAGLWEFPGGKIESGETPEAALIRELREELAEHLDVAPLFFSSVAQKGLQPLKDAVWKAIMKANPMLHNPHFQ